jgi:hypothetical protein
LVADSKSEISEFYQSLAPCIYVDTRDSKLLSDCLKEIRSNNPVLYMPITNNNVLECQLSEVPIFSCMPHDYIGSGRAPEYRLRSKVMDRCALPCSPSKIIGEVPLPCFPPPESNIRRYKARNTLQSAAGGHARFGAFCRLAKLDVATLTTWSLALKAISHSKLYFSYIQTNKISEHYTKSFFADLGLDPGRIIFLPRLSTNDYLELLSSMDIVFGATPEQGGISCFDSLMCNVPYIVNSSISSTYTASFVLESLGLKMWDASSNIEFVEAINALLSDNNFRNTFSISADLSSLGNRLMGQYIDSISGVFSKFIAQ